ncbi:MAG TPA: glycine cleavage system protein GcvH [Candidatus Sulfomarinibacteraceae bacterium]|nr:glycine cleavage system protein GcvH [Candidatus Sulfomarinibacteraceae bacterium]
MTKIENDLLYTNDDEWLRVEGDEATVGITDYAQDSLSDIVYLELPDSGETLQEGDSFGVVESVKAAADLYMPVSGEILEVNEDLMDEPEAVNEDPYGKAWMIRIRLRDKSELDDLMDADAYRAYVEERS